MSLKNYDEKKEALLDKARIGVALLSDRIFGVYTVRIALHENHTEAVL